MTRQDEIHELVRGQLGSIAPHNLADGIAKVVSEMTGDKYRCSIKSIEYETWNAKVEIELNRDLDREK